jgi:hypothetical protein
LAQETTEIHHLNTTQMAGAVPEIVKKKKKEKRRHSRNEPTCKVSLPPKKLSSPS